MGLLKSCRHVRYYTPGTGQQLLVADIFESFLRSLSDAYSLWKMTKSLCTYAIAKWKAIEEAHWRTDGHTDKYGLGNIATKSRTGLGYRQLVTGYRQLATGYTDNWRPATCVFLEIHINTSDITYFSCRICLVFGAIQLTDQSVWPSSLHSAIENLKKGATVN